METTAQEMIFYPLMALRSCERPKRRRGRIVPDSKVIHTNLLLLDCRMNRNNDDMIGLQYLTTDRLT